ADVSDASEGGRGGAVDEGRQERRGPDARYPRGEPRPLRGKVEGGRHADRAAYDERRHPSAGARRRDAEIMNEDKATRYQRLKRQAGVLSFVWSVALLGGLLWSGWTLTLRAAAEAIAARLAPGWLAPLSVVLYVVLLSLVSE